MQRWASAPTQHGFAQQGDPARQLLSTWKSQILDGDGAQESIEVTKFVVTADKITATRSGRRFPVDSGSYRLGNMQGVKTLTVERITSGEINHQLARHAPPAGCPRWGFARIH